MAGSVALIALRLVSLQAAWSAVSAGADVYLFLTGMMILAAVAESQGVFAWLATLAIEASRGSRFRLFTIVFGVGTAVTMVLSNDATAIVLTPAVAVAVRRANVAPLPFMFACAFVANAASFVLPISNPANLIVFAGAVPALGPWLAALAFPSLAAIAATFAVLALQGRRDLRGPVEVTGTAVRLGRSGTIAFLGIAASGLALAATSAMRGPIGAVTFACALLVSGAVAPASGKSQSMGLRSISWSILPLVAGLFVLVRGLQDVGTLAAIRSAIAPVAESSGIVGIAAIGIGTGLITNLTNNLPLGVIAGQALGHGSAPPSVQFAAAIGIDLGPNLSVTGSLATILWLVALRREHIAMDAWTFLRAGVLVMPPALIASLAALSLVTR